MALSFKLLKKMLIKYYPFFVNNTRQHANKIKHNKMHQTKNNNIFNTENKKHLTLLIVCASIAEKMSARQLERIGSLVTNFTDSGAWTTTTSSTESTENIVPSKKTIKTVIYKSYI